VFGGNISMKIFSVTAWEKDFFEKFISISNEYYHANNLYVLETISSFQDILEERAPFNINNQWQAWLCEDEQGQIIGRIFASTRNDKFKQNDFLPVGYFEASCFEVAKLLFDQVKEFTLKMNYKCMRGPIQGNVFNSSRFIKSSTQKNFLGEPLHKEVYLQYFEKYGFAVSQRWISAYFGLWARITGMYNYLSKFTKSPYRKKAYKIRTLKVDSWDSELEIFYTLMMDSFSEMDDVELISIEEFRIWSDNLKHIVKPSNCFILEHEGEPLGFIIGLRDRLPEIAALSRSNNLFNKIRFLLAHKIGKGRLLVNYLGKKKEAEGKVKGVSPKLFAKLAKAHKGFLFTPTIFGYMAESSKTMELTPKVYKSVKHYVMYELSL